MNKALIVIVGLLLVVVLALVVVGGMYVSAKNEMVRKKETITASWAQVDVVLQRRADLIPNLVETVKGIASQEQTVFIEVAKARSGLLGAKTPQDKIAANGQLDSALSRLLVVSEKYPELKSNQNFLNLQDELAGTENRIATERRRYNESVKDYNTFIQLFPNSLFAGFAGFSREDAYFEVSEAAKEAPKVNFGTSTQPPTTNNPPTIKK